MSTPSFKDQNWSQRFQGMGDLAEGEFERVMEEEVGKGCAVFGLRRPPIQVHRIPERIRYMPDYITSNGLVEVQGFGRDQIVKLKIAKYDVLRWWRTIFHVDLFLYDSANVRHTFVELEEVTRRLPQATIRSFPEGNDYYAFPAEVFFSEESDAAT